MKNKYYFFKRLYKDYVIIFDYNGVKKTMGFDKYLLKYIKNDDINYLIVANDFNIFKRVCKNNNYNKHLLKEFLINLVMRDLK